METINLGVVLVKAKTGIALVFRLGGKLGFEKNEKNESCVVSFIHIGVLRQISLVMECTVQHINDVL